MTKMTLGDLVMDKHDLVKGMISRQQARDRISKTLANLNLNTKKTETNMTYKVSLPYRNVDYIFGTAYSHLSLKSGQKSAVIRSLVAASIDESHHMVSVENDDSKKMFEVDIRKSGREGYEAAVDIERKFPHRRRGLNVSAWGTKLFTANVPRHNFLLDSKMYNEVLTWVTENAKPSDYQIYSKFGGDVSIGFRDMSHATMFKLVFAEEDI